MPQDLDYYKEVKEQAIINTQAQKIDELYLKLQDMERRLKALEELYIDSRKVEKLQPDYFSSFFN